MTNEKYTAEGLPVVSQEVIEVFVRDYEIKNTERGSEALVNKLIDRVKTGNPDLLTFMLNSITRISTEISRDFAKGTLNGYLVAYHLLCSQAEANRLEDSV